MASALSDSVRTGQSHMIVHNPVGYPPIVTKRALAPRLETLQGKTIFLIDSRFDDSTRLLEQIQLWLNENLPDVQTHLVPMSGYYGRDDPELWAWARSEADAVIFGVGHCSTCAPAVAKHAVTLESNYGLPTVSVHTDKFAAIVRSTVRMAGLGLAPRAFVPQPVMGKSADQLRAYVEGEDPVTGLSFMREIIDALTSDIAAAGDEPVQFARTPRLLDPANEDALHKLFLDNDWTDKLPIVLPTEERVAAMLAHTSRKPDEIVGRMQPTANRGLWEYTVEKVAVNAVMAGCLPEYFPVVLAIASSGLSARSSTSSSGAAMVVVNGPIRQQIKMNCGVGALGPYNHANATIGRAYGLLSQNLQGGSVPGETYMGSLGNGYTYNNLTFAENEERSPWEPLHVQKGFDREDSTVSIFYGGRTTAFSLGLRETFWREHVQDMLRATDVVGPPTLVLDPIAARQFIDRGGFDTKDKLIRFAYESAQMPAARYWDLQLVQNYIYPNATLGAEPAATKLKAAPDALVPMFNEQDINVVVVGGESNGYWQIFGAGYRTTILVDDWR
ncbi:MULTISPECIES: hypothetical protein [unclassified Sphingobium]|uniref:UGSC family (seleno)protein n=1 Tax=unclassified Sphingobium TaxID=2611147 RepID=UPI002224A003|nr:MULTISPECIES: hypothetical protein [unclassified Sphingobium]MCW2395778.1 hypothetical protein [Sphingobium sp. B8D3B]MCW2419293.1 hypothetical protein [Sphingobium sp. B8D3C]